MSYSPPRLAPFLKLFMRWPETISVLPLSYWMFQTNVWHSVYSNGTPLQYSCLENPMDWGAWWAAVHGVAKSRTRLSDFTFTFHFHALEEMANHSSVLAWRIPGTEEPSGLPSMGSHRVWHDWSDLAAVAAATAVLNCNQGTPRICWFIWCCWQGWTWGSRQLQPCIDRCSSWRT